MEAPISILIANYNNGHFFGDCFESLVAQNEKNWEAVVIDDASTDNSVEIITEMIKNDERFRFFQNEKNTGYQRTLIKAIQLSTAPIFARLDPDDTLSSNAIEKSLQAHNQFPEVGLVYSNISVCDKNLVEDFVHKGKQVNSLGREYYNLNGEMSAFASFKRKFYDQTSGIDPFNRRAEDKDIYMKMCEVAPVKYIDEVLYQYRIHDKATSTISNWEKADFWHMVALIKMAERRNINIEDIFLERYVHRSYVDKMVKDAERRVEMITNSQVYKLMQKMGVFKMYRTLWKSQ